jgi:hypothetical protein
MSEPTLIQTFNEVRLDVAEELGYTRTEGKWSSAQVLEVNRRTNEGYRNFLFSSTDPSGMPHRWSFLEPLAEIIVWPTTTGTTVGAPVYSDPSSTITATVAAFYPSMIGKNFTFDTSGVNYVILSVTSTTVMVVTGDASGEAAADTYTITADGNYRLPDDFGSISGDFLILESGYIRRRVTRTNIAIILQNRTVYVDYAFIPDKFAIIPEAMTGTTGQRQNVAMYPTPNAVITFTYVYSILPDALTATKPYPKGSEVYSEAIRYGCLAEVEKRNGIDRGYRGEYERLLANAVKMDLLMAMPDTLGYNADPSTRNNGRNGGDCYDRTIGALPVYYNGIITS